MNSYGIGVERNKTCLNTAKNWIAPFSVLKLGPIGSKQLQEVKIELYRKTLFAILAKLSLFAIGLAQSSNLFDLSSQ